ncbi:MAG: hypothetical protein K2O77_09360 [Limosilactobacillus sp.]|uniref:hypothetical protein n=1 Tax=Limosilactobacillus TaxID=2742598 RepID=UPI001E505BF5|nr:MULTISPECIES: hypothetical protein [Limosilactobacillus]MCD7136596.1 hypothetical protein [Limosilactobacillus balticus]MDE7041114.1 hypothetical protein [Limosilactobacillus sp.]
MNYGNLTVKRVCRKIAATFFVDELQKIGTVEDVTLDECLDSHTVQLLRQK